MPIEKRTQEDQARIDRHMAAYECQLATCKFMHMPASDVCEKSLACGQPENCPGFNPEHLVRVARADSGEIYASRTEMRAYLDETLGWFKTKREAKNFIDKLSPRAGAA